MKGIVFTEFLDMVEEKFSAEMVDDIIAETSPESKAAYTAVGTYSHEELVNLVVALAARTKISPPELVEVFGQHLFHRFYVRYPRFFENVNCAFDFLAGIEDIIHAEVLKLYPDAQLPRFIIESQTSQEMVLVYQSARHFGDLAQGLMKGCAMHFNEDIAISRENIPHEGGESNIRFRLSKTN